MCIKALVNKLFQIKILILLIFFSFHKDEQATFVKTFLEEMDEKRA